MTSSNVLVSRQNRIALVQINRPEALNSLTKQIVEELEQVFLALALDAEIRAVVLTGNNHFAAGADIEDMVELNPESANRFSFRDAFSRIEQCPKPVIAAISGFALGGGLELALTCDLRIAGPDARLGLPEINLGIFPGAGGTQRLTRLIGPGRAKEMIFSGAMLSAGQAYMYGLVNLIADSPLQEAMKLAESLASKPPVAIRLAKQCVGMAFDADLRNGVEFEAAAWASTFATRDQREGMQSFLQKRTPVFTGE